MIVRYHQLDEGARDAVRSLENKGHIAYIRYLLLKRTPLQKIDQELTRVGLSSANELSYKLYFTEVLFPLLKSYNLDKYYKVYKRHSIDETLQFSTTFGRSESDRVNFCSLIEETETQHFFGNECVKYYGVGKVPLNRNGEAIISAPKEDLLNLLLHEKRHVIDGMLADGYSAKNISEHLDTMYDMQVKKEAISNYAVSFMNTQRKDLEQIITGLEDEKKNVVDQMEYVRSNEELFTIGERVSSISNLKSKMEQLDNQIKRLQGAHGNASYSQGVLEYANMREIFSDVMLRTHRRYKMFDERTEDIVVDSLSKLTNMMAKASDKIIGLDQAMNETSNKTISEEMLEVITPTLDRVESEERKGLEEYNEMFKFEDIKEEDILGLED